MSTLEINQQWILVDETPIIKAKGLRPEQKITLVSHLEYNKKNFVAFGFYIANKEGNVINTIHPSLGGSFKGVEPNGLFWSAQAVGDKVSHTRLRVLDVQKPLKTLIYVIDGHQEVLALPEKSQSSVLSSCVLHRYYIGPNVIRQPVRDGRVRGTLFIPKRGVGKSAGILDLFGSTGGLLEYRASLLASRGFCALALAYFDYDDLQENFTPLEFEYFEEALCFLGNHPSVDGANIGVIGVSQGGSIALYLSILFEQVKAVAAIAPFYSNVQAMYTYKDKIFNAAHGDYNRIIYRPNNVQCVKNAFYFAENIEDYIIKVEEAKNADYLFIHGSNDQNTDPRSVLQITKRLMDHGKNNFELCMYEGAGHLIEPPYSPFCRASYHKLFSSLTDWGGELMGHARAQEDHWKRLLQFFTRKLNNSGTIMPDGPKSLL